MEREIVEQSDWTPHSCLPRPALSSSNSSLGLMWSSRSWEVQRISAVQLSTTSSHWLTEGTAVSPTDNQPQPPSGPSGPPRAPSTTRWSRVETGATSSTRETQTTSTSSRTEKQCKILARSSQPSYPHHQSFRPSFFTRPCLVWFTFAVVKYSAMLRHCKITSN